MSDEERERLHARIAGLIDRLADGSRDDAARNALLDDLAAYQQARIPAYGNLIRARRDNTTPALPTDVFRFTRVASHPPERDTRIFVSSGTTQDARSQHPFRDLSLYDRAARAAARFALFPDRDRMPLVVLAPSEEEAPASSLAYMLSRFSKWFGEGETCVVWRDNQLDLPALRARLAQAQQEDTPVALLGTSFAFVHALDGLGEQEGFALPHLSRVMLTGGYKGRSREVAPEALRDALGERLGIPQAWMVNEYGMTELSSQMYDTPLREAALGRRVTERRLWTPGWVRATLVDADGLSEVPDEGLIRIDDAANLDSVSAIQTADVGRRVGDGFVVLGRAAGAVARGCSLAVDQALEGSR